MGKTLTLSPSDQAELGRRLGVSPRRAMEELLRLADRHRPREYSDIDPSGVLKLRTIDTPMSAKPSVPTTAADAAIDAAIGRGAIPASERADWQRRYREAPETITELLEELPGDPARGARAYEEDSRLRAFSDAFENYLGIPEENRGGGRDFAEQRPRSLEDQWLQFCGLGGGA